MNNSEIARILVDQASISGCSFVRIREKSRLVFASQSSNSANPPSQIATGIVVDVTKRWGGLSISLGLTIRQVSVETHKGLVTADLQCHSGNYPQEFDPWCKLDEESLRSKVIDLVQFFRQFQAAISNDLKAQPVSATSIIFGRPSRFWLLPDLYPPSERDGPPASLHVPPIVLPK
jgi:hypothetical protein